MRELCGSAQGGLTNTICLRPLAPRAAADTLLQHHPAMQAALNPRTCRRCSEAAAQTSAAACKPTQLYLTQQGRTPTSCMPYLQALLRGGGPHRVLLRVLDELGLGWNRRTGHQLTAKKQGGGTVVSLGTWRGCGSPPSARCTGMRKWGERGGQGEARKFSGGKGMAPGLRHSTNWLAQHTDAMAGWPASAHVNVGQMAHPPDRLAQHVDAVVGVALVGAHLRHGGLQVHDHRVDLYGAK